MNSTPQIFKERLINSRLAHFTRDNVPDFAAKFKEIGLWCNATAEKYLDRTKETTVQGAFMTRLFNQVFGYLEIMDDTHCYNQERENKTILDTTEADGVLGFFHKDSGKKDVRVVIELKDARTPLDKKQNRSNHLTPVEQAFSYANKNGSKCGWVIVSNFVETRLYKSNSSLEYETFDMRKMKDEKEFLRFYYFLCKEHLIAETGKSIIDELYQENEAEGVDITNQFYRTYKTIRNNLFTCLKENNPDKDDLLLFTKSQKLMDRFTFICFCEDCDLLPQNIFNRLIETAKQSFSFSPNKLWEQLRGLFASIDQGNPPMKINRYNGGLFKADSELDSLVISDEILESFTQLSTYDFNSDLNVNILGQIFEQSISDVEQIKNEISGVETDGKGKQKDDGIFYTPYYVTRYIVEQTVGTYLSFKKEELKRSIFAKGAVSVSVYKESTKRYHEYKFSKWTDIPVAKENMSEDEKMALEAVEKLHLHYWNEYENVLRNIKICDPACGSGAFLNQCFDYLHEEMDFVLDMKFQFDNQRSLFDIDKQILQNNLFGVDINPESVEITKLSLWLKTAKNNQTLATLDENIKCGNSIVASKEVAENAFDWQEEFPEVFANGGFDIIVGNPPYGAKISDEQKKYIFKNYRSTQGGVDTYKTFFELGFNILKKNGYLGFITPNTFLLQDMSSNLRTILFVENSFTTLVELYNVFPNAVVEPVISVFQKVAPKEHDVVVILVPRKTKLTSTFVADGEVRRISTSTIKEQDNNVFRYKMDNKGEEVLSVLYNNAELIGDHFKVTTGIELYGVGKGNPPQTEQTLKEKPFTSFTKIDDTWIPLIRGTDIYRYATIWHGEYVKYGEWLRVPKSIDLFAREKLFIRRTGDYPLCCYDNDNYVPERASHALYKQDNSDIPIKYILGVLNSKLIRWVFRYNNSLLVSKPLAQVNAKYIERLPLKYCIAGIEEIVDELIELYKKKVNTVEAFLGFLNKTYLLSKPSEKLEEFYTISYNDFIKELQKKKIELSAKEKMELLPIFENTNQTINNICDSIISKENEIDRRLFKIYGLSDQQIKYILEY